MLQDLYTGKASELHAAHCKVSQMTVALKKYRKDKLSDLNWHQVLLARAICLIKFGKTNLRSFIFDPVESILSCSQASAVDRLHA